MADRLSWGVLGPGAIARAFVADLALTGTGVARAVGSRHLDSATAFGEAMNVPRRHGSYQALVADPDIDVVYVATPHPFHHAHARLALVLDMSTRVVPVGNG